MTHVWAHMWARRGTHRSNLDGRIGPAAFMRFFIGSDSCNLGESTSHCETILSYVASTIDRTCEIFDGRHSRVGLDRVGPVARPRALSDPLGPEPSPEPRAPSPEPQGGVYSPGTANHRDDSPLSPISSEGYVHHHLRCNPRYEGFRSRLGNPWRYPHTRDRQLLDTRSQPDITERYGDVTRSLH